MTYQDPCMSQCAIPYLKFMTLREFYIQKHIKELQKSDLQTLEKAIDSL